MKGWLKYGILGLLLVWLVGWNLDKLPGNEVGSATQQIKAYPARVKQAMPKLPTKSTPELPSRGVKQPNGSRLSKEKVLTMTATAYNLSRDDTASGLRPGPGRVAVDPRVIPLGTKLHIENYGFAVAADTGRVIKNNRIDVWFADPEICKEWGRKKVKVYIYEKGPRNTVEKR